MLVVVIGTIIGVVLGLTGAGGSVFAVPLLVLLLNLPAAEATGLALAAVASSAALGTLLRRKQQLAWSAALVFAATGMMTAPLGQWLGNQLPGIWVMAGFTLLALAIAQRMWHSAQHHPEISKVVRGSLRADTSTTGLTCRFSPSGRFELKPRCLLGLAAGGLLTGLLSGLFGVGGGFLVVPMLNLLTGMTMHKAVGTSLLIITLISTTGFFAHLHLSREINYLLMGLLAIGGSVGMLTGTLLSHRLASAQLQKLFALALVVLSLLSLGKQWT